MHTSYQIQARKNDNSLPCSGIGTSSNQVASSYPYDAEDAGVLEYLETNRCIPAFLEGELRKLPVTQDAAADVQSTA